MKKMFLIGWGATLMMFIAGILMFSYIGLQGTIPTGWDESGNVVNSLSPYYGFGVLPVMSAVMLVVTWITQQFKRERENVRKSRKAITRSTLAGVSMLAGMQAIFTAQALGAELTIQPLLTICAGVFLIIFGNYLPKTRPSLLAGIPTPWAMNDDLNWRRTSRFAGVLFIIFGGVMVVSAFILSVGPLAHVVVFSISVPIVLPIIYSWAIRRKISQNFN